MKSLFIVLALTFSTAAFAGSADTNFINEKREYSKTGAGNNSGGNSGGGLTAGGTVGTATMNENTGPLTQPVQPGGGVLNNSELTNGNQAN